MSLKAGEREVAIRLDDKSQQTGTVAGVFPAAVLKSDSLSNFKWLKYCSPPAFCSSPFFCRRFAGLSLRALTP